MKIRYRHTRTLQGTVLLRASAFFGGRVREACVGLTYVEIDRSKLNALRAAYKQLRQNLKEYHLVDNQ